MKRLLSLSLAALLLAGCASSVPGQIRSSTSEFDGTKMLHMKPGWLSEDLQLGLVWHSRLPADSLLMKARVPGAETFADGKSLKFNVDGEIVGFRSVGGGGGEIEAVESVEGPGGNYYSGGNKTTNTYLVSRAFVERIIEAEDVQVRAVMRDGLREGEFSQDGFARARPAFRDFLAEMEAEQ